MDQNKPADVNSKKRNFCRKSPCGNCPYRKDAPLQLWDRSEFEKLAEENQKQFGGIYDCHKKDGHICVGYLMLQEQHGFPNINLRLKLLKNNVDRTYLDKLHCKAPLYSSVEDMIRANFPDLL